MPNKVGLRIEILVELEPFEADFWAYQNKQDSLDKKILSFFRIKFHR